MVEMLCDTVIFFNLHFLEGNLHYFLENLQQLTQGWERGPKTM